VSLAREIFGNLFDHISLLHEALPDVALIYFCLTAAMMTGNEVLRDRSLSGPLIRC
jgi:hypothetical protein